MPVRTSDSLSPTAPPGAQLFRLEQRCGRCKVASTVQVWGFPGGLGVDGPLDAQRAARRSAVLSCLLAPCVACGKRSFWGVPLSALLAVPVGVAAAVLAAALALPFAASQGQVLKAALCAGLLALGFASGLRVGQADGRVRR